MFSEPGRDGPGKHKRDTFQAFTAPFIKPEAVVRCVHRGFGGTVGAFHFLGRDGENGAHRDYPQGYAVLFAEPQADGGQLDGAEYVGAELLLPHGFGQIAKRAELPVTGVVDQNNLLGCCNFGFQLARKPLDFLKGLKTQRHLQICEFNATWLSGQGDNPITFPGKESTGLTANSGAGTGYQGEFRHNGCPLV